MSKPVSPSETAEYQNLDETNANFVQLSRAYLKAMRGLARKSPIAHEILYYFVETMGRTTNCVVVSYQTLGEVTGVSRPTVGRAIRLLKEDNWIESVRVGNVNAICVNARVFWQAAANQKRYAKFSATVVASETEQDSDFHKKAKEKLTYIPHVERDDIVTQGTEALEPPDQADLNF